MANGLENLSDESLMEHVWKNDHQAFTILVERRSEMFFASAYRIVMSKEEAEDVVQEAFLKIWDRPMLWKAGKKAKFTTWFYKIVMNIALDKLRKSSKVSKTEFLEDMVQGDPSQEKNMVVDEEQRALESALKTLPEKQFMALNLCFYEGLSNKEAAEVIGVNVKALESLLMRAKSGIKNYLHREGVLDKGEVA